jgi:hypothetical protein
MADQIERPTRFVQTTQWGSLVVCSLVSLVGGSLCSGVLCGLLAEQGAYHRRYLEECEALAPLLADDPAFTSIEIWELSSGGAHLFGEVATQADLLRLRKAVIHAVGESRSYIAMTGVWVKQ